MIIAALLLAASASTVSAQDRSAAAAVQVVQDYYAAIQHHDYAAAHALWSGGHSLAQFRKGYAKTAWVKLTPVPPVTVEGAAGSLYADVQVRVDAGLKGGQRQRFVGVYTLRRVNDVDGATVAQRRWHITSAKLKAIPAGR
jgi:hypothetical protein